jgi:hypothetical protein
MNLLFVFPGSVENDERKATGMWGVQNRSLRLTMTENICKIQYFQRLSFKLHAAFSSSLGARPADLSISHINLYSKILHARKIGGSEG